MRVDEFPEVVTSNISKSDIMLGSWALHYAKYQVPLEISRKT